MCLKLNDNVGRIVDILMKETHNGFPVVDLKEIDAVRYILSLFNFSQHHERLW